MSQSWLFQSTPDRYGIDGEFKGKPEQYRWIVTRYIEDMEPGDQVFIWRARGKQKAGRRGIIGCGKIARAVEEIRETDAPAKPWIKPHKAKLEVQLENIILLDFPQKCIKDSELKEDSILKNLGIFRFAQATNFKISTIEANRLEDMFENHRK